MLNEVKVIDSTFEISELRHISTWCERSPMRYEQTGDPGVKNVNQTRFTHHFDIEDDYFINHVQNSVLLPNGFDINDLKCYDSYINFYDFSTPTTIHDDFPFVNSSITVLFFASRHWNHNWGGEIIFYDKNYEAKSVISYKPNRFVAFDGSIQHCVKQPSVIASYPRYSITLKFKK